MSLKAKIYTKDSCIFCVRAKTLLTKHNIPYEECIVDTQGRDDRLLLKSQSWVTREELLEICPGAKTLPQIWLDGEYVGGYTELAAKLVDKLKL